MCKPDERTLFPHTHILYPHVFFLPCVSYTFSHCHLGECLIVHWGVGLIYDKNKTESFMAGGNQHWYCFKNCMIEHLGCSSTRSGGQEHFKAKQHAIKENKMKERNMNVNINLVSAAIQVCKIKSAGMSYETMVGFISACMWCWCWKRWTWTVNI